jgi:hypothetical protein
VRITAPAAFLGAGSTPLFPFCGKSSMMQRKAAVMTSKMMESEEAIVTEMDAGLHAD